jgi:hypothetical protein
MDSVTFYDVLIPQAGFSVRPDGNCEPVIAVSTMECMAPRDYSVNKQVYWLTGRLPEELTK